MRDFTLKEEKNLLDSSMEELLREGARKMLGIAIEAEVTEFVSQFSDITDSFGMKLITRSGYHNHRKITTCIGDIDVRVPRTRDNRRGSDNKIVFNSSIVPRYLRRISRVDEMIPFLYLKGISSGHFSEVLSTLAGQEISISSNTVLRLTEQWQEEYTEWSRRDLSKKKYIYWWVDGIYFNVRCEDDRSCFLVIIGATVEGRKELIYIKDGFRESELSWESIILDLKNMGLKEGPKLATVMVLWVFGKLLVNIFPVQNIKDAGFTEQPMCLRKCLNPFKYRPKEIFMKYIWLRVKKKLLRHLTSL